MTALSLFMTVLGSLLLGATLTGAFGFPIVAARARAEMTEAARVVEGVRLARDPADDPPSEIPIGAEPAGAAQVRVDVTGRADGPRTSGNAAPPLDAQPPPRTGGPAGPHLLGLLDEPKPGEPGHPDYPWTVYPMEPGLGEHDEEPPPVVEPVRQVLLPETPRGPRHAAPDPLTDSRVDAMWPELVALLEAVGVEVDPLALPCSHCEGPAPHTACVGCACPCKLAGIGAAS